MLGNYGFGSLMALTACNLLACGGDPMQAAVPDTMTAAEATGRTTVLVVDGPGRPLVVDWKAEQRTDLEVAMRQGVAVVKYGGEGLQLLTDCRINGTYGFVGVTTKKEVVRLENEQEIRANLPLAGAGLVAKLGGELQRGSTVDVAMVIVGKSRTTWISPTRTDLEGRCDGATHFVRGATVGAFVMDSGASASARTVAQLFGAGAEAGASSSKGMRNQDGSLEACDKAQPESDKPPGQCAALIRLELNPIVEGAPKQANKPARPGEAPAAATEQSCPRGMVLSAGKCSSKDGAKSYACGRDEPKQCKQQCELGNAESCDNYGVMHFLGKHLPKDQAAAARLFDQGCKLGWPNACLNSARLAFNGWGGPKDHVRAMQRYMQACRAGSAGGCYEAAFMHGQGIGVPRDTKRAAALYRVSCNLGEQNGCNNLGVQHMGGDGVPLDLKKALHLFKRSCDGGNAVSCGNTGLYFEFGMGVKQNKALAVRLFDRACKLEAGACGRLATAYQAGFGIAQDDAKARLLWRRTCTSGNGFYQSALACSMLNVLYGERRSVDRASLSQIVPIMKPQCTQGVARACGYLGAAYIGLGDHSASAAYLKQACKVGDYWACDIMRRLKK